MAEMFFCSGTKRSLSCTEKILILRMMKIKRLLVGIMAGALSLGAARGGTEEDAVLQTERNLAAAYQISDADAITRGVMPDYVLTNSRGKLTTRADDLEEARKVDPKYEIFENRDMKARVHGDTAVVTGITHTKGISGGRRFDAEFQFTDTFVKDEGRWRLFAGQAGKLPIAAR